MIRRLTAFAIGFLAVTACGPTAFASVPDTEPDTTLVDCDASWETLPQEGCETTTTESGPAPSFVPPPQTIVPHPTGTSSTTTSSTVAVGEPVVPSSPSTTLAAETTTTGLQTTPPELPRTGSTLLGLALALAAVSAGVAAMLVARRRT